VFLVRWYDVGRTGQAMTFESGGQAQRFVKLLGAFDKNASKAVGTMAATKRNAKLVDDLMAEHVDMLTWVSPGQLHKYRSAIRDYFDDELGHKPVDQDVRDAVSWVQRMQAKGLSPVSARRRSRICTDCSRRR
jgi:hypothetical protein